MGGPNCKHYATPYLGDARGSELKEISKEDAEKQYELTQKQRYLERGVRKRKRRERIFEKSEDKEYANKCKNKVSEWQKRVRSFTEERGLTRSYSRESVEKVSTTVSTSDTINANIDTGVKDVRYVDVTNEFEDRKKFRVKKQKYFIDNDGNKYQVDGRHVIMKPTKREEAVAEILGEHLGEDVNIIPRVNEPTGVKTPDYIIANEKYDLKQITGNGKYVIQGNIKGKSAQANNFVIDITNSKLSIEGAKTQIKNIYQSKHYTWVNKIVLIKNDSILKIYKQK